MEASLKAIIDSLTTIAISVGAGVVVLAIIVSGILIATAGPSQRRAEMGKHGLTYAMFGAVILALAKTIASYLGGFK